MWNNIIDNYTYYMENEKKLTKNTLDAYIRDAHLFNSYISNQNIASFTDINKTTIITYLVYLQRKGKSSSTISRNLASIRCLFQYLLNNRIISEDPTLNLKSPRKDKKPPAILTMDEVNILLETPDSKEEKGSRDKAILGLLYATGLRVSELSSLNIDSIDIDTGIVKLPDGVYDRIIPIGKPALLSLKEYLTNFRTSSKTEEPLFINYNGTRLTRQGLWKIIKSYSDKAEIKKSITPQILRNSSAIHSVQNCDNIKTM